ncbi:hypothetical protein CENA302_10050 [Cylindrospermopsis raciborskii CENA302]|uniref:Uncharacterized protein n=1 Tax=Cylindrospermopsis raciborskii CENA302 TaxID=1170768 RepID=A0A9Q5QWR8_9CYAN|nr:hypothetical protein BCV64_15605 [Cylindrospermopsis raciborskii MVCC14]OHY31538.1 hypothetical protein BCV64_15570 [Cylindrospermopsis raciborskii MVCC14]OPH09570.1 hypothetical protein CENA302_10050 [Cylindrospermopsis raciborskii CENA302]
MGNEEIRGIATKFVKATRIFTRSPVVSGCPINFPASSQGKFLNVVRRPIMAFSWLMVKSAISHSECFANALD